MSGARLKGGEDAGIISSLTVMIFIALSTPPHPTLHTIGVRLLSTLLLSVKELLPSFYCDKATKVELKLSFLETLKAK